MKKFAISVCLFTAWCGQTQPSISPQEDKTENPLKASIVAPEKGRNYQAPATVLILVGVEVTGVAHEGDTVTVDFFANTNKLGFRKSVWHEGIKPDPHSRNFQPMIMGVSGFGGVDFDWTNVPAGSYALTAKASGLHGLSAVSEPVNITVSSSNP